jgi:hypothetical protein
VHRFAAAALLPVAHPHYSAHTGAANRVLDPMLLLECCRQAETYAAHAFYGVEPDAAFVLKSWTLSMVPGAFTQLPGHDAPTQLVIGGRTHGLRMVAGAARGLTQDFELWADERPVASARIEVGYLSRAAFTTLRARGRRTPPDSSLDHDSLDHVSQAGQPVAPHVVGRVRAEDTLLLDLRGTPDETTADLRLPTGNPSLLDHAHDHIPGTVLVEAARQLAIVAADRYRKMPPDQTVMTRMSALFSAYAELDVPTTLRTRATDGPATVEVVQDGARIALIEIGLALNPLGPLNPLNRVGVASAERSARWARQPSLPV